jgi:ribosomal protein S18 acetylase RimI-like enzyme
LQNHTQNQTKLKIRPATQQDVEPLVALSHRTILVKYPEVIGLEMVEGYVASGAVPQYYRDNNSQTRVAELDGQVVGACAVKENAIDLMMVTVEQHRVGIGSQLLRDAEARLFAVHDRLTLDSFRDNAQAVDFYKKHGWTVEKHFVDPDYKIAMVRLFKTQ